MDELVELLVDEPEAVDDPEAKAVNELVELLVDKLVKWPVDEPVENWVGELGGKLVEWPVDKLVEEPEAKAVDNPVNEPEAASKGGEIGPNGFGNCKLGGVLDNWECRGGCVG